MLEYRLALCLSLVCTALNAQTSSDNNCTRDSSGNDIKCPSSITSENITYNVDKDGNLQSNSGNTISISGGSLKLTFSDVVKTLTTTTTINISGGSMEVNWSGDSSADSSVDSNANAKNGIFELRENASLSVSSGSFKSDYLVNLSKQNNGNGNNGSISITGGNFKVGYLGNGNSSNKDTKITFKASSGTLKATAFENYGTAKLENGTSMINNLTNYNSLTISGGTNTISYLVNNGTADINSTSSTSSTNTTISNGTNTITYLSNSGTLNISNGTNNITTFSNSGTATISGGTNNFKDSASSTNSQDSTSNSMGDSTNDSSGNITNTSKIENSGTLTISGGMNTIGNFLNSTNGTTTISGGTNNIDYIENYANLIFGSTTTTNGTTTNSTLIATIKNSLYNYGTATITVNQQLKLESNANFENYGTLSGSGKIEGGIFHHYGTFSGVKGEMFSNLDFNNYTNLTIKNNSSSSDSGDLDKLDVNNFGNYASSGNELSLEGNLTTKGFDNGLWANFVVKSGGTLTINTGGKTTIDCSNNSDATCCKNGTSGSNSTCEIESSAQNSAGFFTLESGGNVKSHIDFINTGYLIIEGGTFEVTKAQDSTQNTQDSSQDSTPSLKNQNGVIYLKGGSIKGNIETNGYFSMSGGTIENGLTNHNNFLLSNGNIKDKIINEGGTFTITGGSFGDSATSSTTSSTTSNDYVFTNKIWEQDSGDSTDSSSSDSNKTYTAATLNIYGGNTSISTLKNESKTISDKTYQSVININGGTLKITDKLDNEGIIYAYSGTLSAEKLLQNNNGVITAYSGATISAKEFDWGSGLVNFVNGNSGYLSFDCVKISTSSTTSNNCTTSTATSTTSGNSRLNMDFSLVPIVFGKDYYVIKTESSPSNVDKINVESNAKNNLAESAKDKLTFTTSYKNGYIAVSASMSETSDSLQSLLSQNALKSLGETVDLLDSIKNIDSSDVLSHIISNPNKVASELKSNNESIATNHAKSTHYNLATSLNTLNRLNKSSTPRKIAFSDTIAPTYNFANANKKKHPLIRFANYEKSQEEAHDSSDSSDSNETFTLEDLALEYQEELENAKLKYNQLIDYDNNLYASLFGIFGSYGGSKLNAFGFIAGYDIKLNDGLILGANFSYANANKSHNIGLGGYGRAYIQNNEIDFGFNVNVALSGYDYSFLGYEHKADFTSFGFNANATYGYLFNVYKTQFFKPFAGISLYYANTPQYKENGKYARHFYTQNSFEMSLDLGAEYRVFLKKNYYVFAQLKFEQFVVNTQNGLFMRFGDGTKFNLAQYKGYRNYIQALIGGDFAIIKDTFNVTANIGYKMAIMRGKINNKDIDENFITINVGAKYMF